MTRVLGDMMPSYRLRDLACQLVQQRIGTYADEIVRQQTEEGADPVRVVRPRTIVARERAMRFREEQLPGIVIAVPGSGENTGPDGDGRYFTPYLIEVHAIVESTDEVVGEKVAAILALAGAKALYDGLPSGLDGRIGSTRWEGEGNDDRFVEERTRHASVQILSVNVEGILSAAAGPLPEDWTDPARGPAPDPGDLPTVERADLTTEPVQEIAA